MIGDSDSDSDSDNEGSPFPNDMNGEPGNLALTPEEARIIQELKELIREIKELNSPSFSQGLAYQDQDIKQAEYAKCATRLSHIFQMRHNWETWEKEDKRLCDMIKELEHSEEKEEAAKRKAEHMKCRPTQLPDMAHALAEEARKAIEKTTIFPSYKFPDIIIPDVYHVTYKCFTAGKQPNSAETPGMEKTPFVPTSRPTGGETKRPDGEMKPNHTAVKRAEKPVDSAETIETTEKSYSYDSQPVVMKGCYDDGYASNNNYNDNDNNYNDKPITVKSFYADERSYGNYQTEGSNYQEGSSKQEEPHKNDNNVPLRPTASRKVQRGQLTRFNSYEVNNDEAYVPINNSVVLHSDTDIQNYYSLPNEINTTPAASAKCEEKFHPVNSAKTPNPDFKGSSMGRRIGEFTVKPEHALKTRSPKANNAPMKKNIVVLTKEDIAKMKEGNAAKFEEYTKMLDGDRDWNHEFNDALDLPMDTAEERNIRADKTTSIIKDYAKTALKYAKPVTLEHIRKSKDLIISTNVSIPNANVPLVTDTKVEDGKKEKLGGIAGGEKEIHENIVFKIPVKRKMYETFDYAMKAATLELQGFNTLVNLGIRDVYFPLAAVIDCFGYRVNANARLPINNDTLIYGSSDAGGTIIISDEGEDIMRKVCDLLNLRSHTISGFSKKEERTFYGPFDIEVHLGFDNKFYIIDPARIMPSEIINNDANKKGGIKGSTFVYLYRPEFIRTLEYPVDPDIRIRADTKEQRDQLFNSFERYGKEHYDMLNEKLNKEVERLRCIKGTNIDVWDELRLIDTLHRNGFNVRHLYKLKNSYLSPSRDLCIIINTEIIARKIKMR